MCVSVSVPLMLWVDSMFFVELFTYVSFTQCVMTAVLGQISMMTVKICQQGTLPLFLLNENVDSCGQIMDISLIDSCRMIYVNT